MLDDYTEILHEYKYTGYYIRGGGIYHRVSGPARIWHQDHPIHPGKQEWYIYGEHIPVNSQKEFEKYLKLKAFW